jgi:DNA modification methylase
MELLHGDCIEVMAGLPAASVGAVVTDPPYGLEFMGKDWDAPWKYTIGATGYTDAERLPRPSFSSSRNPMCRVCRKHKRGSKSHQPCACEAPDFDETDHRLAEMRHFQSWSGAWAREVFRVLKPGGYLLAFGGTRTSHRLACAIEDAGFVIRDDLHWLYGSGYPKSLDLERAIAVATCALTGRHFARRLPDEDQRQPGDHVCPVTPESASWVGYGTATKPAHEPIILAQKPLGGTYAANVLRWGVGGLNIDACRVTATDGVPVFRHKGEPAINAYGDGLHGSARTGEIDTQTGRWPTNLLLTHHPDCAASCAPGCPVAVLDAQSGTLTSGKAGTHGHIRNVPGFARELEGRIYGGGEGLWTEAGPAGELYGDSGGASRFFPTSRFEADDFAPFLYVAKAARSEREKGLRALSKATPGERTGRVDGSAGLDSPRAGAGRTNAGANIHPTVKPVQLMRWLVRLVTPPGETVLDPFLGSGTTGVAATMEGRAFIGIEREAQYLEIARHRLASAQPGLPLGAA